MKNWKVYQTEFPILKVIFGWEKFSKNSGSFYCGILYYFMYEFSQNQPGKTESETINNQPHNTSNSNAFYRIQKIFYVNKFRGDSRFLP